MPTLESCLIARLSPSSPSPSACIVPWKIDAEDISWEDVLVPFYFSWSVAKPSSKADSDFVPSGPRAPQAGGSKQASKPDPKSRSSTKQKKTPPTTLTLTPHETLGGYALEIFSASGLRRHTYAVSVDSGVVKVWYFDRAGAIGSTAMDLAKEEDRDDFVKVLLQFCYADRHSFGFIPKINPPASWPRLAQPGYVMLSTMGSDEEQQPERVKLTSMTLLSEERSRCLIGRGSMVYSFEDEDTDDFFILKLCWQPVGRKSEVELFLRANGCVEGYNTTPIQGMPVVRYAGDLGKLSDGFRGKVDHAASGPDRVLRAIVFENIPLCKTLDCYPVTEKPLGFLRLLLKLVKSTYTNL